VVEPDGRLGALAGEFAGLAVTQARSAMVKALGQAGLLAGSVPVRQVVGVHERCQTPVEFQIRPQWFIAVREHADRFRARAAELEWIPPFMRRRLEDWIDGLKWDWNITRQRRYGVPFPVWFCVACETPVLARLEDLPVDPLADTPPVSSCPPDGYNRYVPDDVMGKYGADAVRLWATKGRIGTDLRYNEKDIRTGRKFAVSLWNVGRFLSMNLGDLDVSAVAPPPGGRDIVDRWVLGHLADTVTEATAAFEQHDYMQAHQVASRMFWSVYCDRYLEMIKDRLVVGAGPDSAGRDGAGRDGAGRDGAGRDGAGRDGTGRDGTGRDGARWTLWESFRVLLGLFAPFAPFVTERTYQQFYAAHEGTISLHLTR
jgi:valyl-tRNA synthetase